MILGRHGLAHLDVSGSVAQAVFELQVNLAREVDARGVDGGIDQAAVALDVPMAGVERSLTGSTYIGEVDDGAALSILRKVSCVAARRVATDIFAGHLGIYELQLVILQDDARNEVVQVVAHGVDEARGFGHLAFERAVILFERIHAAVQAGDLALQALVGCLISRGKLRDGSADSVSYVLIGSQVLCGGGNLLVHDALQLGLQLFDVGELAFQVRTQIFEVFLRSQTSQIVLVEHAVLDVVDQLIDGGQLGQNARLLVVHLIIKVAEIALEHVDLTLQRLLDLVEIVGHVVHLSLHSQGIGTRGAALCAVDTLLQRGVGTQIRLQRLVGIEQALGFVAGRRECRNSFVHQRLSRSDTLTGSLVRRGCQGVGKLFLHIVQRFDLCVYVSELLIDELRQVARIRVLIDLVLQACNVIVVVRAGNERAGRREQERTENQRIDKFSFHN